MRIEQRQEACLFDLKVVGGATRAAQRLQQDVEHRLALGGNGGERRAAGAVGGGVGGGDGGAHGARRLHKKSSKESSGKVKRCCGAVKKSGL